MPPNGNKAFWDSFDYKYVHFTMVSSEHSMTNGSELYNWIVADLSKADRNKTPWLVFNIQTVIL